MSTQNMADDPKQAPPPVSDKPSDQAPSAASISPAPGVVTDGVPAKAGAPTADEVASAKTAVAAVQKEPLSDGTVPTVLDTGQSHKPVPKGKASMTSIYRKADITTTLFTFLGSLVAAGILVGVYAYMTRSKPTTTAPSKVTTLDKSEIEKLGAFFTGNSAGTNAEILTINSSTFFKNRVALGSDAKVTGALEVTGPSTLGDLTVDKTSTLGVTNVRGSLTIAGPLTSQSPALFNAGASFKGSVTATGNAAFSGSLSAGSITVSTLSVSTLNVNGHLNIGGQQPSVSTGAHAGGGTATVTGNDTGGTVSVNTGTVTPNAGTGGELVKITFRNAFATSPVVVISPNSRSSALIQPYVIKTAGFFIIAAAKDATSSTNYSFDYWVVQ